MPRLSTKEAVFLLSTTGTPTAGNFVETEAPVLLNIERTNTDFTRQSGNLGETDFYNDPNYVKGSGDLSHNMRTNNKDGLALSTAPEYEPLLLMSGFEKTVATDLITYKMGNAPANGNCIAYVDGFKKTMNGASGSLTMDFTAGQVGKMNFSLQGFIDNKGVSVAEVNPSVTLSDEDLMIVSKTDSGIVNGSLTIPFDTATIDFGTQVEEYYSTGNAEADKDFEITDYAPTVTLSYFEDSTNLIAAEQAVADSSIVSLVFVLNANKTNGAIEQGKSIRITIPKAKYKELSPSDEKMRVKHQLTFQALRDDTDSNVKIELGAIV